MNKKRSLGERFNVFYGKIATDCVQPISLAFPDAFNAPDIYNFCSTKNGSFLIKKGAQDQAPSIKKFMFS